MRGSYCYIPILIGRGGHFRAVRALSPNARSRLVPLFDVPRPNDQQIAKLEAHLMERAEGIARCWVPDRPVCVDVHDFPLELRVHELWPIVLIVEALRARGFRPVPVSGTESERGGEYVRAMGQLAARVGNGVCLRVEPEEILEPEILVGSLSTTLGLLDQPPEQVDVVLDLRFVGKESVARLRSTVLESLHAVNSMGRFRNLAVGGGSVPENLPKRDAGLIRRERRVEWELWSEIHAIAAAGAPIAFADHGITNSNYVAPAKSVRVPARVRYTTPTEHVFLRTEPGGRAALCTQLLASEHFEGADYSVGDQRMALVANGIFGGGNPGTCIGDDLNHHLELVSEQVWGTISEKGMVDLFSLPDPVRSPWLQTELMDD